MNHITHPIEPEELMAYLDGELTEERRTVATAHLSQCAECRDVLVGLHGVSQTVKSWEVEIPESTTPPAIADALNQLSPESRRVASNRKLAWREVFSARWEGAEWAGLLALVLVAVVGTVRLIGGNANNVFSSVAQTINTYSGSDDRSVAVRESKGLTSAVPPAQGKQFDRLEQFARLQKAPAAKFGKSLDAGVPPINGPMLIRTAELTLITKEFDNARSSMEVILKRHRGYIGELKAGGATGSGRTQSATLRVPADQLDATLIELKALGRVESESQNGEDVTSQYVDLEARLANARNTERRLTDLLKERTGKLSDVLAVENEHARVRGEIERMEAERKNMSNQVSFATLNVTITEDYRAQLQVVPPSTWTRLGNAAVAGYKSMVDGVVGLALFLLENGPSLILWCAVLFLPVRLVWKRVRRSLAH